MSCTGTSFVQRHLCFRVTTSLLTVLPQLAHLALLQASIRMVFFYLHESYCSTSILTRCHRALFMPRENRFCSFAFLLAWQPSCSFSSSSPLPFNYRPSVDVMPQDFSGLFSLPEKEHVQSSLDQSFAVTSQCLGQRRKALVETRASTLLRPRNTCGFTVLWGALLLLPLPKVLHMILQSFKQV